MGETGQAQGLPDAAGRRAAGRLAARLDLKAFWRDEAGATAIEYGLICGLIFLVIVGSITAMMDSGDGLYARIKTKVGDALK